MASERSIDNEWINKMEAILEKASTSARTNLTLSTLLKTINNYDMIQRNDGETRKWARKIILEASKRIIDRNEAAQGKTLAYKEGTKTRLRKITSYASQLSKIIEPVLLHIDETQYTRNIIEEFMPRVEEAARFATKLDPEMAAQMLRILDSAEILGLNFNKDLREAFSEVIEIHIAPKNLDAPKLLLDLAQSRFQAGEYLTSYLLTREAIRSLIEDLTGAYSKELGSEDTPSPDWRFEDYLGYLMEIGLVPAEEGKKFLELFVGEPEHLNCRWKKRREAERALTEVRHYLEIMDTDNDENEEWL
ncbi:MAG: hypothetical protein ABSA11_05270 [Candidatus Bathyarchaeia archaeon]|jgi:hypothetical protein